MQRIRRELLRRMVLDTICNDYENVDQVILPEVANVSAKVGFAVERSDVLDALTQLIEEGLAKAYLLSATEPGGELQGMPSLDVIEEKFETYFYITKKGMDFHLSDEAWWPFDEEGKPRI